MAHIDCGTGSPGGCPYPGLGLDSALLVIWFLAPFLCAFIMLLSNGPRQAAASPKSANVVSVPIQFTPSGGVEVVGRALACFFFTGNAAAAATTEALSPGPSPGSSIGGVTKLKFDENDLPPGCPPLLEDKDDYKGEEYLPNEIEVGSRPQKRLGTYQSWDKGTNGFSVVA